MIWNKETATVISLRDMPWIFSKHPRDSWCLPCNQRQCSSLPWIWSWPFYSILFIFLAVPNSMWKFLGQGSNLSQAGFLTTELLSYSIYFILNFIYLLIYFLFFIFFFIATQVAFRSSQASGQNGAAAASLHHSQKYSSNRSSLVVKQVQNLALSLLWLRSDPRPGNFHMPRVQQHWIFFFFFFGHTHNTFRPGTESELQLRPMPQFQQHQIPNPLCQARDRICTAADNTGSLTCCTMAGTPGLFLFSF